MSRPRGPETEQGCRWPRVPTGWLGRAPGLGGQGAELKRMDAPREPCAPGAPRPESSARTPGRVRGPPRGGVPAPRPPGGRRTHVWPQLPMATGRWYTSRQMGQLY